MAIKSGQILHDANGFVIDRIQTGGVTNLNIPEERINELGNYETVATVRDTPELGFDIESLDVSTEIEALITRYDPTTTTVGQQFDFRKAIPMDVISPFKTGQNLYTVHSGVAIPYLVLESAAYRFGVRANATQTFTFRGDSVFWVPGSPYYQQWTAAPYDFTNTALPYNGPLGTRYALGVCYHVPGDRTYRRLFHGTDYTDAASGITITATLPAGAVVSAIYGSTTQATYAQAVHQGTGVKPAAARHKDVDIFLNGSRQISVQTFEANWRVTLDADEELGNEFYVNQDYDIPEVTGSVTIRPRDVNDFFARVREVQGTTTAEVTGVHSNATFTLDARIYDRGTSTVLKTIRVEQARFIPPIAQGRVGAKFEPTMNFTSQNGVMYVYKGAAP